MAPKEETSEDITKWAESTYISSRCQVFNLLPWHELRGISTGILFCLTKSLLQSLDQQFKMRVIYSKKLFPRQEVDREQFKHSKLKFSHEKNVEDILRFISGLLNE